MSMCFYSTSLENWLTDDVYTCTAVEIGDFFKSAVSAVEADHLSLYANVLQLLCRAIPGQEMFVKHDITFSTTVVVFKTTNDETETV